MRILTKHVSLKASKHDPLGIYSHLVVLGFRNEPDKGDDETTMGNTVHCLYSQEEKTVSTITEDYAAQLALAEVLRTADTSKRE